MAVFNYFGLYFIVIVVLVVLCHAQIDNLSSLSRSQKALGGVAGFQRRWPSTRRSNSKTYGTKYRGKRSIDEAIFEKTNSASASFRDGLRSKRQAEKMQMWDFHPSSMIRRRILQSRNRTIGDKPRIRAAQNSPRGHLQKANNTTIHHAPVVRGSRLQTNKQVMAAGNNTYTEPTAKNVQLSQEHFNAMLKLGPEHLGHGVVSSNVSTKNTHAEQRRTNIPSATPRRSISTRINQRRQVQQRPRSGINTSQAQLPANQNVGLNSIRPHDSSHPSQQYNILQSQLQMDGAVLDKIKLLTGSPELNNSSSSQNNEQRSNLMHKRPTLKQSTAGGSERKLNEMNRIIGEATKIMQTINATLQQTRPLRKPGHANRFSPSLNNKSSFKPAQRSMTSRFEKPHGKAPSHRKPTPKINNQMSTQQSGNAKQGAPAGKIPVKRQEKLNSLPSRTFINQQLKVQRQHIQPTRYTEPQLESITSKRPVTDLQQGSNVLTPLPAVHVLKNLIKQRKQQQQQPNKKGQISQNFRGSDAVKSVSKLEQGYTPKVLSSAAPKTPHNIATVPTVDVMHQRQTSLQLNFKHQTNQGTKDTSPHQSKTTHRNMEIQNQETWPQNQQTNMKPYQPSPSMINNRPQNLQTQPISQQQNSGMVDNWSQQQQQTQQNTHKPHLGMTNTWPQQQQTQQNTHKPNPGMTNTWPQQQQTQQNTHQPNSGMTNTWPQQQQTQQNTHKPHLGMTNTWPQQQQTKHNSQHSNPVMTSALPQKHQTKQTTHHSNRVMTSSWPHQQQTKQNTHQENQGMSDTWQQQQLNQTTYQQEQHTQQNTHQPNPVMTNTWPQHQTKQNPHQSSPGMSNNKPKEKQMKQNKHPPNLVMINTWPQEQQIKQNTYQPGITNITPQEQQTIQNTHQQNKDMTNTWPQQYQTKQNTHQPNPSMTGSRPQKQQTKQNMHTSNPGMSNSRPQEKQIQQNKHQPNPVMINTWQQEQTKQNTHQPNPGMTNTWPQQKTKLNTHQPFSGVANYRPQQHQTKQNPHQSNPGMSNNKPKEKQIKQNKHRPNQGKTNTWPKEQQQHAKQNTYQPNPGITNTWPQEQHTKQNTHQPNPGMTNTWPQEQHTKQNTHQPNPSMTGSRPQKQQTNQNMHKANSGVANTWTQQETNHKTHQSNQGTGMSNTSPQQQLTNHMTHYPNPSVPKTRPQQQTRKFMHHPNTERLNQQQLRSNKHQLNPGTTITRFQQRQTHADSQPTNPSLINNWTPENPPRGLKTQQAPDIIRNNQKQQVNILSLQPSERHTIPSAYTSTVKPRQTGRQTMSSRHNMANDKIRTTQTRPMPQSNNHYQQGQRSPIPIYIDSPSATVPTSAPRRFNLESSTPVSKRPPPNGLHVSHKLFAHQTRPRNEYPKQNDSYQVNQHSNRPKLIPSTIFPLPNRQKESQVLQTVRPNFVQHQNNDVAVKNPLAPVNLWQPATAVPGDDLAQKDWTPQSPNHQPQETYQPSSSATKTVNGGRYVKNWFLPRNFKQTTESRQSARIQPSTGTKQLNRSGQITGSNHSVGNKTHPLSPPVIVRSNNGRRNSKPLRITVSNRVGGRRTRNKQRRGNKKDQALRGSGKRNAAVRHHHHANQEPSSINHTTARPTPVVTDKNVLAKNNGPGFVDHFRHILNQIREEHAFTHANIVHQTTTAARTTPVSHWNQATSAPTVASIQHNHSNAPSPTKGALPKYKPESNLNARVDNRATNFTTVNKSTNTKRSKNRTISITQPRVNPEVNQGVSQIYPGAHHPPINFNVYLEWPAVPTPTPQRTRSQSQTDALRLLEALKVLQGNMGHLTPPVTQNPPVNIILQVEPDKKPGKLSCRCFNKSDGCPYELKEEPLMDMCDVKTEVPCCDDN